LRYGEILSDNYIADLVSAESVSARILKIGQHFVKLRGKEEHDIVRIMATVQFQKSQR